MKNTRDVLIEWNDSPGDELFVVVSIDGEWEERGEDDDGIFFYFLSVKDLVGAMKPSMEDFRVTAIACVNCQLFVQQDKYGSWVDDSNGDGCLQDGPETQIHSVGL